MFTSVDACKGFYAIKMEETAKKYTSFVTPRDSYCFNVCPFGLVNAPSVYARLTRKLLEGTTNVENFVDDILAHNSDFQGHLVTLKDLFDRVRKANIKLKPSKVRIGFSY
jgi:putative transposase